MILNRLCRKGVLQPSPHNTCAFTIDIQYHSDIDTTAHDFAKELTFSYHFRTMTANCLNRYGVVTEH
jgi:hypothetical protein